MKIRKNVIAAALAAALICTLFTGCGSGSKTNASYEAVMGETMPAVTVAPMEGSIDYKGESISGDMGSTDLPENRKWIVNVTVSTETENLDDMLQKLTDRIAQAGGYTERQSVNNGGYYVGSYSRYAELTVRVPAENVDAFLNEMSGISNVTSSRKELDDITLTYVATESRVKALETEQTRLLELLEQAESLYDVLSIEDRLTDVRYELENVASQLRVLSNRVDYATVYLSIREVRTFTPVAERNMFQRIGDGFTENLHDVGEFLENFVVWFVSSLPTLVLIAAVATAVAVPILRTGKKRKAGKAKPETNPEQK